MLISHRSNVKRNQFMHFTLRLLHQLQQIVHRLVKPVWHVFARWMLIRSVLVMKFLHYQYLSCFSINFFAV